MRRILCLILCLFITSALFAGCQKNEAAEPTLFVGYARADMTPEYSMPLAGFGDNRPSTEVLDPLYITCIALKDGEGNTFLMYHCDFLGASSAFLFNERRVSRETGVPIDNIIVAATHNHSAPSIDASADQFPLVEDYADLCKDAMVQTAKDALMDLKPSKVYVTSKKCEKMTYVRHYERPNGTVHGQGGNPGELYKGYAAPVDDTMELIKFTREGGKDIILMNWQGHPRGHGGVDATYYGQTREERKGFILSDVGVIRRNIEPALDCHFAYFLGASGNVNNSSAIQADQITKNYIEHGERLSQLAVEAAVSFVEVELGTLRRVSTKVNVTKKDGMTQDTIPASVFAIGKSVAFVIVPYEMFSQSSLAIKASSEFDSTFIVTCSEGGYGYMPAEETFDPARYRTEAYEVGATHYMQGTAEAMVEGYKSLLSQLVK